jgi:hypothetical protein
VFLGGEKMFLKFLSSILICTLVLIGCSITDEKITTPSNSSTKTESQNSIVSLENIIIPPKFNITHFKMDYLDKNKQLIFTMNYEIDTDLYDILQKGSQVMYFALEYPESEFDIFDSRYSEFIIAEKPKNYKNKFSVQFIKSLELNKDELKKIKDNISKINLVVADKDKDIIAKFIDLYGFNNFDSNESNSTNLDDEDTTE